MVGIYSKKQILQLYLNTVAFNENIYGVKVAAKHFFNTTPDRLKPKQAAILVAMLKATSTYNPMSHPKMSKDHRNLVLEQMAKNNDLEEEEKDSLQQLPLNHTDGLKIHTTIHSKVQAYTESALQEQMKDLQKQFDEHLGEKTAWENDTIIELAMLPSNRFRAL